MITEIKKIIEENKEQLITIRRYLHQNPELSFEEYKTASYISQVLSNYNIEHQTGVVKTGIIGTIKGKNPHSKVIALRADIDALPIVENTNLDFASQNKGVMHACGHDVHTTALIGALIVLNTLKNKFEGTIKFIFQPGEEQLPGGAKLMIEDKVLENPTVDKIIGQHVFPDLEVGKVGFRPNTYMASADEIHFTVQGKGGHAALPHTLTDPILITAHIIVALQQIVSRNASPYIPTVLSFGDIIGKGATNVIPNAVAVKGTFRTFDEKWRTEAHAKMKKMAESIAEGMGATCNFEVRKGYPVLVNDQATTELAKQAAINYLGKENVIDLEMRMTAEDFAYYSQQIPSCFYRLGTSNPTKGYGGGLHNAKFTIDEDAISIGAGLMSYIALQQLRE